jgi:hypothetical protein
MAMHHILTSNLMLYLLKYTFIGLACMAGYFVFFALWSFLTTKPKKANKKLIEENNRYIKRHLIMLRYKEYYSVPRPEEEQGNNIKNFSRSISGFDKQTGNGWDDEE